MDLTALIILGLKISIMLNVLALGLRATLDDATSLFRQPIELGRALFSMDVVMPLTALALSLAFDLKPAVKIALVALSVSPIPPMFPRKALKAGGKQNYVVGLLVAVGIIAIVLIPITMEIVGGYVGIPLRMSARSVAKLVLLTTLAPLLAGIALRRCAPAIAERAAKPVGILAIVLLVATALPVLAVSFKSMLSLIGDGTLLSVAAFALVGFVTGQLMGRPNRENSRVLALATASRHPGIAAAIAHTNFPGEKLVLPAILLYLIVSGILLAVLSAGLRTVASSALAPAPQPRTRHP